MAGMFKRFFALFIAGFVAMGLAIAEVIPIWLGLTGFVVLILGAVLDSVLYVRRLRRGWPELMEMPEAVRGTAEILEAYETRMYAYMGEPDGYAPKTYALDLRVSLPDRPVYETRHYTTAHPWATSHMVKGNRMPVFVHPTKPKRMHVDFGNVPGGPRGSDRAGTVSGGPSTGGLSPQVVAQIKSMTGMDIDSTIGSSPDAAEAVRQFTGMDLGELIEKAMTEGTVGPDGTITLDRGLQNVTIEAPDQVTVTNTRLDLAEAGTSTTALVKGVRSLGFTSAIGPILELDLEVSLPGGATNRVTQRAELPADAAPTVGQTVTVKVDPNNPGRVLVNGESGVSW